MTRNANECSRCPLSGTVSAWGGVSGLAGGARQSRGIDRGLHCCQTGGEGVLAHGQWGLAGSERPILRIPVSCLLSLVSRGLLNRGHVLGRHLSCNYSTRIRFWWCVMITNNYCAFHASKGPRWGPRASIQKKGGGLAGRWGGVGGDDRKKCKDTERRMKRSSTVSRLHWLEVAIR